MAEDAILQAEQFEEHWCVAELLRIKGEVLVARGSMDQAEAAFLEALDMSRRQAMQGWELRAAMSLGMLWRGCGRAAEAFDLMSAALVPFAEGAATADLTKARQFLHEMKYRR